MNVILVLISIFGLFIGKSLTQPVIPGLKGHHANIGNYPALNMDKCGYLSLSKGFSPKSRIIKGSFASLGEFPWQATIFHKYRGDGSNHLCDGVLIHRFWVLTVKHCMNPKREDDAEIIPRVLNISFGTVNTRVFYEVRNVVEIIRHPEVDVTLLQLETPMAPQSSDGQSYRINQICLPQENVANYNQEEAIISGFGHSEIVPPYDPDLRNTLLRKAIITIDSESECKARNYPIWTICAPEMKHMTCYGDPGAGLVQFDGVRAMLIGILVGGYNWDQFEQPCSPGIQRFVRVSYFIGFIRDIIDLNKKFDANISPKPNVTAVTHKKEPVEQQNKGDDRSGCQHIFRADKAIALKFIALNGDSGSGLVQFDGKRAMVIAMVLGGYNWNQQDPPCSPGIQRYLRDVIEFDKTFKPNIPTKPALTTTTNKPITTSKPNDPENEEENKGDNSSGDDNQHTFRSHKTIVLNIIIVLINLVFL